MAGARPKRPKTAGRAARAGIVAPEPGPLEPAPPRPALPKGKRRTTPAPETLAALPAERLIALILGETARNPAFRKLVSAALAGLQGADAVAAIVDRRLAALESARGYVDWQKRRAFAADLDATVRVIADELRPLDARAALDRLRRFLGGADGVLNRVDDAAGSVQGVYERAAEAFVETARALPPEEAAGVADGLVAGVASDPFGPLGALLHDLIPGLPEAALPGLDAALSGATPSGDARAAARGRILRLRQTLADRRGDADAYVALEGEIAPGREDRGALARRLLAAGRPEEALAWLRRPQKAGGLRIVTRADLIAGFDPRGPERERSALEVDVLDALGRGGEAQALRWDRFARELDAPMLRAHLAKLPDFEDEEALHRALEHASAFPDPHRALAFLVGWPDLARAAALVAARAEAWRGERYDVLAPAADALAPDHPVAATLLYRRLLDLILGQGHSGAYAHAARYWLELDGLAERLPPGAVSPEPDAYREAVRRTHGRKHAFWGLLKA